LWTRFKDTAIDMKELTARFPLANAIIPRASKAFMRKVNGIVVEAFMDARAQYWTANLHWGSLWEEKNWDFLCRIATGCSRGGLLLGLPLAGVAKGPALGESLGEPVAPGPGASLGLVPLAEALGEPLGQNWG
jgi:hypothetical protein